MVACARFNSGGAGRIDRRHRRKETGAGHEEIVDLVGLAIGVGHRAIRILAHERAANQFGTLAPLFGHPKRKLSKNKAIGVIHPGFSPARGILTRLGFNDNAPDLEAPGSKPREGAN